jgi:Na+/proline symporter
MTRWIEWLRKLDWVQWLALIALFCTYAVIAMPFLGLSWKRTEDFSLLVIILGAFLLFAAGGKTTRARPGPSGLSHLGRVAMALMFLWGQPWWPVPRPQQASDFWVFVWPFIILVNATRILLAESPDRDSAALEEQPGLV